MTTLTLDSKVLIDTLLGKDTTPEVVDALRAKLKTIVLPWRPDGCMPPKFERVNGLGQQVAVVDGWLGGYGSPHEPHHHGWGYSASNGQGHCIRGIKKVIYDGTATEKEIQAAERAARDEIMDEVDAFLKKQFGFTLLHEPIKEGR